MALIRHTSGRPRPAGGGKLALFEVLQANSNAGDAEAPPPGGAAPAQHPAPRRAAPEAVVLRNAGTQPAAAFSRLSLVMSGVALVAVVVAGAVIFSSLTATPRPELAGEAMPEVLDVGSVRRGQSPVIPEAGGQTLARPQSETHVEVTQPAAPFVVPADFRRVNGLNYVLVQSYAASEEDRAIATRDALLAAGIGATIERNVPGWGRNICVVGTVGFERVRNNPEYQAYRAELQQVSEQHRGNRKIKSFDPSPVQWTRN